LHEHPCKHVETLVELQSFVLEHYFSNFRVSHASSPDCGSRLPGSALRSCRLEKRRLVRAGPEPRTPHPRVLLLRGPSRTDKQFLLFFFSRLRSNQSGRYEKDFPFLSLCGRERNFLRCDDRPVVFTHLLQSSGDPRGLGGDQELLSFCGGAEKLAVPFRPEALYMHPASGRVYHPCPERTGGVGLVRSALAIELSPFFVYPPESSQSGQPTHFLWGEEKHTLTNELSGFFPMTDEGSEERHLE
uniref:Chromosome 8 open reading frame 82 n=1 Tax=Oryzias melastigma TaxID=30732 RepID=A0A3B3DKN4_ORYME